MKNSNRLMGTVFLTLVFLFFYLPILSVVVYSFNESPVASVWTRFSLQWYAKLAHDTELLDAAWVSLVLGLATAFASVFIGAWIGFVLATYRKFSGNTLFSAMINAPMVLPEVISGISLLLLFVAMEQAIGWPERGMTTMWIGHVMICISYVAITVQARLSAMDKSLPEAARDLGATPLRVFFDITLPLIAPSLFAGFLLSLAISLDDIIMSAFLQSPGTTTLPLVLFSRIRLGLDPEINALGTLIIVASGIAIVGNSILVKRREIRQAHRLEMILRGATVDSTQGPAPHT